MKKFDTKMPRIRFFDSLAIYPRFLIPQESYDTKNKLKRYQKMEAETGLFQVDLAKDCRKAS